MKYEAILKHLEYAKSAKRNAPQKLSVLHFADLIDFVCSNVILDGSNLSRLEIQNAIEGDLPVTSTLGENQMIENYVDVFDYFKKSLSMNYLDEHVFLKLYHLLTKEYPSYRNRNRVVAKFGYMPPNSTRVSKLLAKLFNAYFRHASDKTDNKLLTAAYLHAEIIKISPFNAANDSIARVAMYYFLMQTGFPPPLLECSDKEYIDSMHTYIHYGKINDFYAILENAMYEKLIKVTKLLDH